MIGKSENHPISIPYFIRFVFTHARDEHRRGPTYGGIIVRCSIKKFDGGNMAATHEITAHGDIPALPLPIILGPDGIKIKYGFCVPDHDSFVRFHTNRMTARQPSCTYINGQSCRRLTSPI